MTNYTVRVELHEADDDHYDALHDAMEAEGFVRWIKIGDTKYQLPTAEYNLTGSSLSVNAVRDRVKRIANSVKSNPTPWILVTESNGRRMSGLMIWKD